MKAQPQFVIGMDGGGTKTAAMIADEKGNVLAEHLAGPSNFQIIGVERAARTIFGLLLRCCRSVHCSPSQLAAMTVGLTGAGRPSDQKRMAAGLIAHARMNSVRLRNVAVESDARIALEGAFRGEPGIILIAGTGSIAFGKDRRGKIHRVGGWGRILGDEGSGYYIGRTALETVTKQIDGRERRTTLPGAFARAFGLRSQQDIISAVYRNGFDLASLAPVVLRAAARRDPAARAILGKAADELVRHVASLAPHVRLTSDLRREKLPVAFIGGLLSHDTLLARNVRRELPRRVPGSVIMPPMTPPVYGAVLMALSTI